MNFSVYWQHADAVSKTLYFILLAMSIATWTIFVLRIMGTRQLKQQAYAQLSQALAKLKSKFAVLNFEQRKAVAEQALLRQISAEKVLVLQRLYVIQSSIQQTLNNVKPLQNKHFFVKFLLKKRMRKKVFQF